VKGKRGQWEKLGRILAPDPSIDWMSTFTGAAFASPVNDSSVFDVYVTGRDRSNRSRIGRVRMSLEKLPKVLEVSPEPVLSLGPLGAFDENGVSYPCLLRHQGRLFLYYTGWMPTVLTPFQNHLGLAIQQDDGRFIRVSRAPILERTNEDYLSIGSVCVLVDAGIWKMWYTGFFDWGQPPLPQHRYRIKYATSEDGVHWNRENRVCIDLEREGEHSICRPTVYKYGDLYHMWYCYRGKYYRIGYAFSDDGISWTRSDENVALVLSEEGWDSQTQCYPNVFRHGNDLYMLYCGNNYGQEGLGLARFKL